MNTMLNFKNIANVMDTYGELLVPYYQRGYRWRKLQIEQLLVDLFGFSPTSEVPAYFLQMLVLSAPDYQADGAEDHNFHIVDGQQRLTTISLIRESLGMTPIKIRYERGVGNNGGVLDECYIKEAKKTIAKWIEDNLTTQEAKISFCKKVADESWFLVYQIGRLEENRTFERINSGKLPAKDSELVKCIFLQKRSDEPAETTQDRASQWDVMERSLNNGAFYAFAIPPRRECDDDPMTAIFQLAGFHLDSEDHAYEYPFLNMIQRKIKLFSREVVWERILQTWSTLQAWFNDSCLYHAYGWFMYRNSSDKGALKDLPQIGSIYNTLSKWVDEKFPQIAKYHDLYWGHDNEKKNAEDLLFLTNIAYCVVRGNIRYDFSEHRKVNEWSLEHIFAKNQQDLESEKEFSDFVGPQLSDKWVFYHACVKEKLIDADEQGDPPMSGDGYLKKLLCENYPDASEKDDSGLQNLALLSSESNKSLGNKLFLAKREAIHDFGDSRRFFIPPLTEKIFDKAFPGADTSHMAYFSGEKLKEDAVDVLTRDRSGDKKAYVEYMYSLLKQLKETLQKMCEEV